MALFSLSELKKTALKDPNMVDITIENIKMAMRISIMVNPPENACRQSLPFSSMRRCKDLFNGN
jgi:hypothetical protein